MHYQSWGNYIKNLRTKIEESKSVFIACKISCVNQSSNAEYDEYVEHCNKRLERISAETDQ